MSSSTTSQTPQSCSIPNLVSDPEKPSSPPPTAVEEHIDSFGPAPDGGLIAWLNVLGGFCIFFSCLGFTSCFGVLQEYYSTHQLKDKTMDEIAWIGSVSAFIQFAGGAVGGPMFDRFGVWILRPATFTYVLGLMMVSLCDEYYQFILAQSLLMGGSVAFLQFPAFAITGHYFDKRRAAAMGVVVSGSSIGGVVFPIVMSKLLNSSSLSFGWTIRILAFMVLPFMLFACVVIRPRFPPRKTTIFNGEAWKNKSYVLIVSAFFFMLMGMWTPLFYIPVYAVRMGMSPLLASYLLAVVNGSSTFGRIIPGILADKLGRLNMFAFAGISTGILVFCFNQPRTNASIIVYSVFFGFVSGTIISAGSAAISVCTKDPRNLGTLLGMGMGFASCAVLAGPPINGALLDRYHGFEQVAIFSGVICLFGGFLAVSSKIVTPEGLWSKL